MKTRAIITTILIMGMAIPAQGQFLKKLKDRAKAAVERTVLDRTDQEVSKGTNKTIDGITQGKKGEDSHSKEQTGEAEKKSRGSEQEVGETEKNRATRAKKEAKGKAIEQKMAGLFGGGSLKGVPDTYTFSYRITMRINNGNEETEMEYLMEPDQRYFGSQQIQGTMSTITLMDMENKQVVMFSEDSGRKSAMKMPVGRKMMEKMAKKMEQKSQAETVEVVPIESKTILGYTCQGFQVTSKEGVSKIWLTNETPVGFLGGMGQAENIPTAGVPIQSNTMFMEMQFQSSKRKKDNYSMVCTDLAKEELILAKADYLN